MNPFVELETYADIPGIVTDIAFDQSADLPAWARTNIVSALKKIGSEMTTACIESVYAAGPFLNAQSWRSLAQIASLVSATGQGNIGKNGRALAIYQVALRNAGLTDSPDPANDPAISIAYGKPVDETEDREAF